MHADMCHLPLLQEKCLKFVDGNAERVLKSNAFLSLPEDNLKDIISRDTFIAPEVSVFRAVLQWKEHNKQSRKEMEEILKCVRLSEISPQDLFAVVEPFNLFQEPSILRAIRIQVKPELEQMQPRGKKGWFAFFRFVFCFCCKFVSDARISCTASTILTALVYSTLHNQSALLASMSWSTNVLDLCAKVFVMMLHTICL